MRSLNVRCPVCGRCVSVIGRDKIARHNNYASADVCKGSGADGTKVADEARRRAEIGEAERDLYDAERALRRARENVDKATAWSAKCLDDVMRLRVKLAAMQPDESAESETHAEEFVVTLEVQS